jgi:hypothetical protein
LEKLDKLIFVKKIGPMTLGLVVNPSLVKLIEVDEGLKAKLDKFEGTFEKDEILEIYLIIEKIVKYFHHFIQVIIF